MPFSLADVTHLNASFPNAPEDIHLSVFSIYSPHMGMYTDLLHRIQPPAAAWNPVISRFCSFDRAVTLGSGRSLHKGGQGKLTLCHATPHNCGVTKEVTNSLRRVANSCTRSLSTEVELGDIATVYPEDM